MTLNPPGEASYRSHSMPGLVDGNSTPRNSSTSTSVNNGPGARKTIYRRHAGRYPHTTSPSSRGSRFTSYRGSSFTKRRWLSNVNTSNSNSHSSGVGQERNLLSSSSSSNNNNNRGRMPSEFDQSGEMVTRGPDNHFAPMNDSDVGGGGSSTLSLLVTAGDANANLAGVVVVDPSTGSSVDGLVSSCSTDSEDLDDTSSSAGTSLSPSSSTSLGSPEAKDIAEKAPSPIFSGNNSSRFTQSGTGFNRAKLLHERDQRKENVNKLKNSTNLKGDVSKKDSAEENQGDYREKDTCANIHVHDAVTSCYSIANIATGELDENDNCDKPLAHILSQVNSCGADQEELDYRKYHLEKVSYVGEDNSLSTPSIHTPSNDPSKTASIEPNWDVRKDLLDQALGGAANQAATKNSSSTSRLIPSEEDQVQLSQRVNKANADVKQGRALNTKNSEVQFIDGSAAVEKLNSSGSNADSHSNDQRQRSLDPESRPEAETETTVEVDAPGVSESLSIDTSSVVLKRPRSYPQVSQKTLFTPIPPPSPEQSGLYEPGSGSLQQPGEKFVDSSSSSVDVPTTTVLTSIRNDSSRTTTTTTTTTTNFAVAEEVSSAETSSVGGKRMNRPQKLAQSSLPVARVNPQANPNVSTSGTTNSVAAHQPSAPPSASDSLQKTPQYPFYPQHQVPQHHHLYNQQQQQPAFFPSPQLYPIPPGVYMHDPMGGNPGYFAPSHVPVVFLSEPPTFCDQSFFQDTTPASYQPYNPHTGPRMPPPVCFAPESGPCRQTGEAESFGSNSASMTHRNFKGASSTLESLNSNSSDKSHRSSSATPCSAPPTKGSTDQKKTSGQSDHKLSPRNTPSSGKKKPHKQPLLPDPLIPKLSERTSQSQATSTDAIPSSLDVQSGIYHPQQHHQYLQQNPCQPPGPQQMMQPHHPFFLQQMAANGSNPSVFHGNFLEHMGPSTTAFSAHSPVNGVLITPPPPGHAPHLHGQHSAGLGDRSSATSASNSASSTASPAPESVTSSVSFVTDSTGLVIYGPQPPAGHSPAPLCLPILSQDSTPRPSTAPAGSNSDVEYHHAQQQQQQQEGEDQSTPGLDPENPNQQQQQVPVQGGLLYIPDGSGTGYMAVEVSTVQSQLEAPVSYPGLPACHPDQGVQDLSYRSQDGQPTVGDSANNRKFPSLWVWLFNIHVVRLGKL